MKCYSGTVVVATIFVVSCCILSTHAAVHDDDIDRYHSEKFHNIEGRIEARIASAEEQNSEYWYKIAQNEIHAKVNQQINVNKAKNVVFFLGDGMSMATVTASRILVDNEEGFLSFEKFPHFGLSKTYCTNTQVADSACSATAYLTGVKGNYGTVGLNAKVPRYSCDAGHKDDVETHTESIASWAQKACKATGIVTNTPVTDASPAGNYAHIANRYWENDADIKDAGCDTEKIDDVAKQLIHGDVGSNFKVILGGGRREFLPTTVTDDEGFRGARTDGRNLIDEFIEKHGEDHNPKYIWNNRQLKDLNYNNTDYLLGLFETDDCYYQSDIKKFRLEENEPSLSEMVVAALKVLQNDENGYYLFVEGGRIDHAHHDNQARRALRETEEFAKAISLVRQMTSTEDTLIVVTADHSHTMTISGYPNRGSDIFGLASSDDDNVPFLTLSYANGPGYDTTYTEPGHRVDYRNVDTTSTEFMFSSTVPLDSETHGGDDVGIWASGPMSHLFVGTYEQNNIPVLIAYAAQVGPYNPNPEAECSGTKTIVLGISVNLLVVLVLVQRLWF